MPGHGQDHPQQPHLHPHAASYPPVTQGQYHGYPPDPNTRQQNRSQSYGSSSANIRGFGHRAEGVHGSSVSQIQGAPFRPVPTSTNGFYPQPSLQYPQPYTRGSPSPGTGSGMPQSDYVTGSEGGTTPPFTSSPMSLPSTFESQASQGQMQYQRQQPLQPQMHSSSGSNSPGGIAYEQEYLHPGKRLRGPDQEGALGLDVGMEHESTEDQDGKDSKAKP
jgi:hypothetical protein